MWKIKAKLEIKTTAERKHQPSRIETSALGFVFFFEIRRRKAKVSRITSDSPEEMAKFEDLRKNCRERERERERERDA